MEKIHYDFHKITISWLQTVFSVTLYDIYASLEQFNGNFNNLHYCDMILFGTKFIANKLRTRKIKKTSGKLKRLS